MAAIATATETRMVTITFPLTVRGLLEAADLLASQFTDPEVTSCDVEEPDHYLSGDAIGPYVITFNVHDKKASR